MFLCVARLRDNCKSCLDETVKPSSSATYIREVGYYRHIHSIQGYGESISIKRRIKYSEPRYCS